AFERVADQCAGEQCADYRELWLNRAREATAGDDPEGENRPEHDPTQNAHAHQDVVDAVVRDIGDQRIDASEVDDGQRVVDRDTEAPPQQSALLDVQL